MGPSAHAVVQGAAAPLPELVQVKEELVLGGFLRLLRTHRIRLLGGNRPTPLAACSRERPAAAPARTLTSKNAPRHARKVRRGVQGGRSKPKMLETYATQDQ